MSWHAPSRFPALSLLQLLKVKLDPHLGAQFLRNVIQFEDPTEAEVKAFADAGVSLLSFNGLLAKVSLTSQTPSFSPTFPSSNPSLASHVLPRCLTGPSHACCCDAAEEQRHRVHLLHQRDHG